MSNHEAQLIERHIELNPHKPGLAEARLKASGVAVWALVGYLPAVGGDLDRVAADYELAREAVESALAYYQQHQALIDARLAANRTDDESVTAPMTTLA